jgi:formiminoglutamase
MKHFHYYTKQELLEQVKLRKYEAKLGERVLVVNDPNESASDLHLKFEGSASYVCFGIPESIGVMGNHGAKGAENTWFHFVRSFLNLQSTDLCYGENIILAGYFDFSSVSKIIEEHSFSSEERINACRHAVANIIDEEVEELIKAIVMAGKIPIVIGGGHNNAYPIIKGTAKSLNKKSLIPAPFINVINLDACAEYRILEGRHSGNPFRYAMEEGYLKKYAVIGLQESVNPQSMMDDLYSNINNLYFTYDQIFIDEKLNFLQAIAQSFGFVEDGKVAIELDLDVINEPMFGSRNASGITIREARQFVRFSGNYSSVTSFHLCEGNAFNLSADSNQVGNLDSLLVLDFIKSRV